MTWLLVIALLITPPAYRRSEWRHWLGSCPDVRQRVLIDESRRPVRLSADGCRVVAGEWLDVYTGELVTSAAALDVDHVVSLGAAHRAGGWRWNRQRKRDYANELDDPEHLIAVTAAANRAKSDKGPSRWLPPWRSARCWYVDTYARIAHRWHLTLPAADVRAIETVRTGCH